MPQLRTVILGGGSGSRLFPLTRDRAKPGVPIAGRFRLIDIPLSNCIHSELDEIFILTQFNSISLNQHITETYQFGGLSTRSVRILAAQQTPTTKEWYQGTADAVRQNLTHLIHSRGWPEHLLILSADHLYRMDYRPMIAAHLETNADITLSALPVRREEADRFGLLKAEGDGRISHFVEKPQTEAEIDGCISDPAALVNRMPTAGDRPFLASMGIYLFKTDVLVDLLATSAPLDFGRHIIPQSIHTHAVFAYPFTGYWKDIGTIHSFYEVHLELLEIVPAFDFYDESAPIFAARNHLPSSKINESHILSSMVAEGSIIDRSEIIHSSIGLRSVIGADTHIEDTVIMGADYYQSVDQIEANRQRGVPRMGMGQRCHIRGAIIDKNAQIGDDVVLVNADGIEQADADHYYIRDSIIVVPRNGIVPSGTVI
ncbi:MAG: glucose-1-phosphate adenylyltransferase [Gemmatimonadetes bacterium]|jgi:glucose-1-phosphate adenylyltransferase|nr:glucose-1-phosphate adenylyltransferase [Gemmatimonadota bacterium]